MLIGMHESVAGGLPQSIARAADHATSAVQIFTKNANRWAERPLGDDEAEAFRRARAAWGKGPVVAHASYLINLSAGSSDLLGRSRDALVREMERCDKLGVDLIALHPGAALEMPRPEALARASESLAWVLERTRGCATLLCLENTAGQGSSLGASLDELAQILAQSGPETGRVGICIDTQHLFAAGYDLRGDAGYDRFWHELDGTLGLGRIAAFHLNDSKTELGERVDRHEALGEGRIGLEPFWRLVNDERFAGTPAIVELDDEPARRSIARLTGLAGAERPKQPRVAAPLRLTAPDPPKRRGRTRRV